jgi:uncharacterized protein YecE (DUF72 family)
MKWHIGCSGFLYREWKEYFYPDKLPQRLWFEYYASVFDTLELNVTFYKFPQLKYLQKWYDTSPAHFSFSLKVPRLITHYKQMKDCESLLNDFYSTIEEGLKEKLGCVLFQFPPKFIYTEERLQLLINNVKTGCKNVVELRDKSWWDKKIFNILKDHNIIFSGISHPGLPVHQEPVFNNSIAYYRFHGIPTLFYSEYSEAALKAIADQIRKKKTVKEVFVYFNNTATSAAIKNAQWLREYIGNK